MPTRRRSSERVNVSPFVGDTIAAKRPSLEPPPPPPPAAAARPPPPRGPLVPGCSSTKRCASSSVAVIAGLVAFSWKNTCAEPSPTRVLLACDVHDAVAGVRRADTSPTAPDRPRSRRPRKRPAATLGSPARRSARPPSIRTRRRDRALMEAIVVVAADPAERRDRDRAGCARPRSGVAVSMRPTRRSLRRREAAHARVHDPRSRCRTRSRPARTPEGLRHHPYRRRCRRHPCPASPCRHLCHRHHPAPVRRAHPTRPARARPAAGRPPDRGTPPTGGRATGLRTWRQTRRRTIRRCPRTRTRVRTTRHLLAPCRLAAA